VKPPSSVPMPELEVSWQQDPRLTEFFILTDFLKRKFSIQPKRLRTQKCEVDLENTEQKTSTNTIKRFFLFTSFHFSKQRFTASVTRCNKRHLCCSWVVTDSIVTAEV
jgi:hypothetical protein